jgi:hypothetical protein
MLRLSQEQCQSNGNMMILLILLLHTNYTLPANLGYPQTIFVCHNANLIGYDMQYTCTLIEDGDDLILPIPDEILQTLDIKEGDVLDWVDNKDGTFTIKKQGEMNGIV